MKKRRTNTAPNSSALVLNVDEGRLDEQGNEQVRMMWKYSAELAEAIRKLKLAEIHLTAVEAEEDEQIRTQPELYGIASITEPAVKRCLGRAKPIIAAKKAVVTAEYAVNVLRGRVETLDHRRSVLTMFAKLREQNYFAEPRKPRNRDSRRRTGKDV